MLFSIENPVSLRKFRIYRHIFALMDGSEEAGVRGSLSDFCDAGSPPIIIKKVVFTPTL